MVKPAKAFRKQADKAEAAAKRADDPEHAQEMINLAEAFRAQASAIKASNKASKSRKS